MGIKCKGIVINSYDFKEKDRIIVVYTDRLGKIKIVAKGVKGLHSSKREALMLMALSEYEVREGKNFHKIIDVDLKRHFKLVEYENYEAASFYLKVLNRILPENYVNPKIFRLTDHYLLFTGNMKPQWRLFMSLSFILKFLYLLGDFPSFRRCVCGDMKEKLYIDISASLLRCKNCSEGYEDHIMTKEEHGFIDRLLLWDYSSEVPDSIVEGNLKKVSGVLYDYMKFHYNLELSEMLTDR